jgi:rhodanese-related sulfurtransferase
MSQLNSVAACQTVKFISRVLEPRAVVPEIANAHCQTKLQVETDPSDVYFDLKRGDPGFTILDVRSPEAFAEEHVPGAVSMPHRKINSENTATWSKSRLIVVYCYSPACNGAAKAAGKLTALGFPVKEMIGGIEYWKKEGYPVQRAGEPAACLDAPVIG